MFRFFNPLYNVYLCLSVNLQILYSKYASNMLVGFFFNQEVLIREVRPSYVNSDKLTFQMSSIKFDSKLQMTKVASEG